MTLYRKILKQALSLSWKNKYLWFFGLFAALIIKSEYDIVSNAQGGQSFVYNFYSFINTNVFSSTSLLTIKNYMVNSPGSFALALFIIILIILLVAFLIWLVIVSQSALVNNSAEIYTGKNHDLKNGLKAGRENFWPILGFSFLIRVIIYAGLLLISIPIITDIGMISKAGNDILYMALFFIFLPILIILSFIIKYAVAFKIIKNESFSASIKDGWNLFTANWIISLEMAFLLFFISFFVTLITVLLWYVLSVPTMFLAVLGSYIAPQTSFFWLIYMLPRILYLITIALIGSFLATFQTSAWTGLFIELVGKGATSKIVRIYNSISGK